MDIWSRQAHMYMSNVKSQYNFLAFFFRKLDFPFNFSTQMSKVTTIMLKINSLTRFL